VRSLPAVVHTRQVAAATANGRESAKEKTVTDNILDGILDTPFPQIADQILHDAATLARLEAETAEYVKAIELLRPYMEGFPTRTVREALELMRADMEAASQHQAAPQPEAQTVVLLPAPTFIQISRGKSSMDDKYLWVNLATAEDLRAQVRLSRRGSFRRTWTEGVLAEYGEQLTDGVQLGDVWPALREAVTNRVAPATKEEPEHV